MLATCRLNTSSYKLFSLITTSPESIRSLPRLRVNFYYRNCQNCLPIQVNSRQLFSTFTIAHNKSIPDPKPPKTESTLTKTKDKKSMSKGHTHSHKEGGLHLHHHHSMHDPNEFLATSASNIRNNAAVRITWIGLLVNIALAVSKGIGGVVFHSQALIADAIHSVSDMVADFLTLATVNVASKIGSPTKFPLGYGKIETIGSFSVSAILLFAGISVGWSSLVQIFEFTLPTYLYDYVSQIHIGHSHTHTGLPDPSHGHSHSHSNLTSDTDISPHKEIPNINAAWLAGASIVVKELLFRKTLKVAEQTNSKVLVANAWHHRVDSLTAFVALVTVTGGVLFNVAWLDSIGGIGVSFLIIKAGWDTMLEAWYELIDRGEKPGSVLYDKIDEIIKNELRINQELQKFRLNELSVLSSGANTNIHLVLATDVQGIDIKMLNVYEQKLSQLIREDDKFVRKVFISFKQVNELPPLEEENVVEEEDEEESHEHSHEHSHQNHTHEHKH
ncbi:MMT2 [[Candida] subhashii]|uniref:MMT2 n=1 Tax=[Candida] subhashii TaxID=561895 RepID=A0A8J5UHB9_9ASCO|nr:MMT2 [[Candida] subhashii]KAG7660737.1 MMT2 [[Candida] subhashii]